MNRIQLLLILFLSVSLGSHAQLAQTRWKGTLLIPGETASLLTFKKDTLDVFVSNGEDLLESMTYVVVRDTMILKKISGSSSCDTITGRYKWAVQNNSLYVTPLSDECSDRFRAWTKDPFIKVKD